MKIGFIGTGNMGKYMVANLIKAGHELTVNDIRKEAAEELLAQGAKWADTPKAVAQASQITISSLPGPKQVEEVALGANGILAGAGKGHYYIDMSTNAPSSIRKVAAAAAPKGIEVLDAPVTGGTRGARRATLTIMVGGNPAAFEFCLPVLKRLGERVILVGSIGAGCVTKLVNNMMSIGNAVVAMEALILGAKAGVDIQKLFEVAESGTGSSLMLKGLFPYIVFKGRFEPPSFSLALAAKDLRLGADLARELNVPAEIGKQISDAVTAAEQQGLGGQDIGAYVTILEKATGVQLRTDLSQVKEAPISFVRLNQVPKNVVNVPLFTGGTVAVQQIATPKMGPDLTVYNVNFSKGARNKFHTHSKDQVLLVSSGRGIVATEKEKRTVEVGDIIHIPAGVKHWHGATEDSDFAHVVFETPDSRLVQLEA